MEGGAASRGHASPASAARHAFAAAAVVVLVMVVVTAVGGTGRPSSASASTRVDRAGPPDPAGLPVRYDLALGDSLSVGVGAAEPSDGYVDLVYRAQRASDPALRLVDLGCSGATTTSFVDGGGCRYPDGSQLAAAESFLEAHPGHIAFVTIDVGINDVDGCMTTEAIDATCVAGGLRAVSAGLTRIMAGLRRAGPGVVVYGADYYDPYLAAWFDGAGGRSVARQSRADVLALDTVLARVYRSFGVTVVPVADRFSTMEATATETAAGAAVPVDVQRVCAWTWMCLAPNLHPNDAGHAEMAAAFDDLIAGAAASRPGPSTAGPPAPSADGPLGSAGSPARPAPAVTTGRLTRPADAVPGAPACRPSSPSWSSCQLFGPAR